MDLKPCPFCGGPAELRHSMQLAVGSGRGDYVSCPKCCVDFRGTVEGWNRRDGWISVDDRMPEADLAVLVARYGGTLVCMDGLFENGKWIRSEGKDVTHWRPLPDVPEGVG